MVNLNNALQSAPSIVQPHISTYGSAAIRYQWAWKNAVGAAIRVGDDGNSLVYLSHLNANANETHNASAPQVAQIHEGMWWKQEPGVTCFLAMTNTSLSSITANLKVFGPGASYSTAQSVVVGPHATSLIELAPSWGQLQGNPTEGGVRVSYTGIQGGLQLDGGLIDIAKGYSHKLSLAAMPLGSSSAQGSTGAPPALPTINLDSTGMMIGAQDPNMQFPQGTLFAPYEVLRNTSTRAFQVQLKASYPSNSGPTDVPLGAIMLSPQEVQQVDMKDLLAAAGLGQYNGLINLRTTYVGNPSDLLAEAGSVDQTMSYVFETPPRWEAPSGGRILSYWNTAADTDTMITVWNHSNQAEDLILTFYHQQGQYKLPIHLLANGSTSLSVAWLIKSGQPDATGNVIPATITQGSGKLTSAKGELKRFSVSLHIGVFNVRTATCTCPCAYCNPLEGQSFSPGSLSLTAGSSSAFAAYIYLADGSYDVTSEVPWTSDNTSVATVTSNNSPAVGAGAGVTDIGGFLDPNVFDANSGSDCMGGGSFALSGPESEQSICGTTSAAEFIIPTACNTTVTFIGGLGFIFVGTDSTVTGYNLQQVSGSPGGGSYSWFGPSGSDFSFSPNFSSTADVVTATSNTASTSVGDKTLTVHYTLNGVGEVTPATKAITVRAFKFVTQYTKVPNSIPPGSFGYSYNVTYDCNMAPDGATLMSLGSFTSIVVNEQNQQTSSNSNLTAVFTGAGTTNDNSRFMDGLKLISSTALPSNIKIVYSQNLTILGVAVRSNTLTFGPITVDITNNGPTH